jgi:Zn-dependent M28 family amino/carboxypeptidase
MLFEKFEKTAFFKSMLVIDGLKEARLKNKDRMVKILKNQYKARGIIYTKQKKLTWSVATEWDAFPVFYVLDDKIKSFSKRIKIDISPDLKQHIAENLVGFIKGKTQPDSFVVFSAHYDHLGMLGPDAIFRGANDNASGVAMMLDIMQYYATFPPAYSVAFIAFSGEEAGLFGSYYYTQNPLFPLNQISLLINLDLMGTGDEGMTVVNGEIFKEDFLDLTLINLENNYLPDIKARGKAPNSDHYYFSENGVRAFFFYLMGKYNYYHDVGDVPDELTFSRYNEAFKLITSFASYKMTPKL